VARRLACAGADRAGFERQVDPLDAAHEQVVELSGRRLGGRVGELVDERDRVVGGLLDVLLHLLALRRAGEGFLQLLLPGGPPLHLGGELLGHRHADLGHVLHGAVDLRGQVGELPARAGLFVRRPVRDEALPQDPQHALTEVRRAHVGREGLLELREDGMLDPGLAHGERLAAPVLHVARAGVVRVVAAGPPGA
jgi:hypothetical protein